ncbi:hypothetical protein AT574_02375 [Phaeobacter inhibens]|nr:hypothetical protein AT574_02375 [Phaeobacter inhibens]
MVFNLGIGGNTSIDVRRRAKAELSERNIEATILMLGVNDLRHEIVTGEQQVPFDVFKKAYSEIVEICLEFGSLEILSLFPLQPNKRNTLGAHQYRLSDWEKYNNSIRDIASYYGVHMTNLENSLTSLEGNNLHFDLVHPNSHGHRAIFNALDASFKT